MENFFRKFKLEDKEEVATVISVIDKGVVFRGTNLWILIFAIFVASLGLNVNSTAVIIGAMLISPLMGPIMGIGLSIGINDVTLLKKSILNYGIATIVALTTSTLFFLISPLNDAHSEILARTSPSIYDVLIALFGGFAGIVATSSRQKGNVIPGVAIATALMPPLCTAGYGLATFQLSYFIGAFYLFVINTVFIALATLLFVRTVQFPLKHLQNPRSQKIARRIIWLVVLVTLIPSLYFGYDLVQQDRFTKKANRFIANEAHFPNDYLLSKRIDPKKKEIALVFGGERIASKDIDALKARLQYYELEKATLQVNQGFAYLDEDKELLRNEQLSQFTGAIAIKDRQQDSLRHILDSIKGIELSGQQLFAEMKAQYPEIDSAVIQPGYVYSDTNKVNYGYFVLLNLKSPIRSSEKGKLEKWLKVRLGRSNLKLITQQSEK
ncbi:MAG: TIGR00341 family protein [Bacteroidetes bacterium]|nr:TIGR00341 family protein [Bacteroidota bacterium]